MIVALIEIKGKGFVPDFNSRDFAFDFPCGLSILIQVANIIGAQVPTMQSVYDWYELVCGEREQFSFKAIPHNSTCRYGERGASDAKQKAQIILCVLSSIFATQMACIACRSGT